MTKTGRNRADKELYELMKRWIVRGISKDEISRILAGGMFDIAADDYRSGPKL